jgi:Leucine-rich repeat (LRR) protein
MSPNILYKQFGCDAILCPAGTFHPNGAASLFSGCKPCPVHLGDDEKLSKVLGRTTCNETTFLHGDLNGDGIVSEREALRLLYTYTIGRNWGAQFESWADPMVNECDLNGVTCLDGSVAKLDLTDAALCHTGERKVGIIPECKGIPAEISLLSNLEILVMSRRQFLRGSLPSEIGKLAKLRYMDISSCPYLSGPVSILLLLFVLLLFYCVLSSLTNILAFRLVLFLFISLQLPSELGNLSSLRYLNLGGCRFNGTIPEDLFKLTQLEKLHLTTNSFSGSLSSSVGLLTNVKELMLSRTQLSGKFPDELGELTSLENVEMYADLILLLCNHSN